MPKYSDICSECNSHFEIFHSLHETYTICKSCGEDGYIARIPSEIFIAQKDSKIRGDSKAGSVVESAITEAKEELKQDQSDLKTRRYKK